MAAWTITVIAVVAAGVCLLLWQRALALVVKANIERQAAERARQAAEVELRRQATQLEAVELAQTDAVLRLSPDRTVVQLNAVAGHLFGPKAAPGQTLMVATRSVDLDELVAHVLAGGEDHDRQVILNGQPYRARAARAGEFGAALVLRDLSEVQRLGRARRDFIANISHELRTPLTSIRLLIESLLSGVVHEPEQAQTLLQKINTEVQALEQMAQELLDLAQIESGQAIARLLPTPVDQMVHTAVERLQPQAQHKRQRLQVEVPADLVALADGEKISRALGNLLHNAIKFTPPEGVVQVRAEPSNGDILITVADTVPGIPPADLPRVFERFFRGDRARASGGTGLGLAIAKHVVEAHGGRIWVEGHGLAGHGATFCFTLLAGGEGQ